MESATQDQISDEAVYIQHKANTLPKGMHPYIRSQAMDKS